LPKVGNVTIGRDASCGITVNHPSVSREHAVLRLGGELAIADCGSTNGTRVGERPVGGNPVGFSAGDVLHLGAITMVLQPGHAKQERRPEAPSALVVRDPAMTQLYKHLERVAASNLHVLILGETGVGKEVAAEAVHRFSPRAANSLLRINCAALPEQLLESELFGHTRGAFTGASADKPGLLEGANGGTVFLDEIGDLPLALQAKLLRVIEDGLVRRVGGVKAIHVDVRFVAATNRDLEAESARGGFRQDLFFRLSGATLTLPPLRARVAEIEPLAKTFLAEASVAMFQRPPPMISKGALSLLEGYAWPGNIRELRNVMRHAMLLCQGSVLEPEHLPHEKLTARVPPAPMRDDVAAPTIPPQPGSRPSLRNELQELERQRIVDALEQCAGNQSRAAELLGMSRRVFVARLDTHGIPRPRKGR
jgi:DNA-binding NtrC family response regulator